MSGYYIDPAREAVAEDEYLCPDGCDSMIEPGDRLVRTSNGRHDRYVLFEHLAEDMYPTADEVGAPW